MKRILFYFGFVALMGVASSCSTDYGDDIDNLNSQVAQNKADIATLQQKIAAGKLISKVESTTSGFLITFSDNSTITLSNGTNGNNGAAAFVPVIGVDDDGYWTVITENGGTPTRIQSAGKDIKAVASVPVNNATTNTWWIDGKDTGVSTKGLDGTPGADGAAGTPGADARNPYIGANGNWYIYNTTVGAAVDSGVKAKGVDGTNGAAGADGVTTANVKVIAGVLHIDGVATSVTNCPVVVFDEVNHQFSINFTNADGTTTTLNMQTVSDAYIMLTALSAPVSNFQLTVDYGKVLSAVTAWDGVSYTVGQALINQDGEIVLPVMVSPIDANLALYDITLVTPKGAVAVVNYTVSEGYDYDKYGFPTRALVKGGLWSITLEPTAAEMKDIATLAVKDMAVKATLKKTATQTLDRSLTSKYEYGLDTQTMGAANIPTSATMTDKIGGAKKNVIDVAFLPLTPKNFYKTQLSFDNTHTATVNLKKYLTLAPVDASTKVNEATIVSSGSDEAIRDLDGQTIRLILKTIDYTGVVATSTVDVTYAIGYDDVDLGPQTKTIAVAPNNTIRIEATDVAAKLGAAKYAQWRLANDPMTAYFSAATPGVSVSFLTAAAAPATGSANFDHMIITIDPDFATLSTSKVGFSASLFNAFITLKLVNAAAPVFTKNPVLVTPAKTATIDGLLYRTNATTLVGDLAVLYSNPPAANVWGYEFDAAKNGTLANPLTGVTPNKTMTVSGTTMDKSYKLDVYYYPFGATGNYANKILIETLTVTPKSTVQYGNVVSIAPTTMVERATINLSDIYKGLDSHQGVLDLFESTLDPRVATVTVTSTGANAGLIGVTPIAANDFALLGNPSSTVMLGDADVTLKVVVTDIYGKTLTKEITVTVTKLP